MTREEFKLYFTYTLECNRVEETRQVLNTEGLSWEGIGNRGQFINIFTPHYLFPDEEFKKNPTVPVLMVEEIVVSTPSRVGQYWFVLVVYWNEEKIQDQWAILGAFSNLERVTRLKTDILTDRAFMRDVESAERGELDKRALRDLKHERQYKKERYHGPKPWPSYTALAQVEILTMRINDSALNYDPLPEPLMLEAGR